ncbi:TonB-dependent receptor family protein [Marinobacter sp. V034]|uniref:TonB-dependent receptor family protein n=1 Tax=Marinobacter sp. V034 TaxID=3459610 RepID=UPI0040444C58
MLNRRPIRATLTVSYILFNTSAALAAEDSANSPQNTAAEEQMLIQVTSPRLTRNLYETPAAVTVVDAPEIQQGQQRLQLDESLNNVPGLFFQNQFNFAQGLRLSTRGFGARSPFGIRGIYIQVDDIPYTLPDGQSQIDALSLDSAQRIEIIRGPSSVQYGNSAGGVIDVTTARGDESPSGGAVKLDAGSDGYRKGTLQANGNWDDYAASTTFSWLDYDGYRQQSAVQQGLLNSRLTHRWSEGQRLTATLNLLETPEAEDPGGLTQAQVDEDRQQAARFSNLLDAGQTVSQQTVGLLYEDPALLPGELRVSTFFSLRDFEQQLPFPGSSLIGYDRRFYGASTQYQDDAQVISLPLHYVVGVDIDRQSDKRRRYTVSASGQTTGQTQQETQNATATGLFAQGDLELTPAVTFSLGGRYDHLRLSIDDKQLDDGNDSGSRTFEEFSGVTGLSYRFAKNHQAYMTVGTAFESPTFTEFANPDGGGGFNPDIEPQTALNREIGLRGTFNPAVAYEVALFSITVDDEILPFEQNGRTFYENAGKTQRDGIELGVTWDINYAWQIDSALTLADYRLKDFVDEQGNNADGNRLPGLPNEQWVTEFRWRSTGQRFAALEVQYTGNLYAENSNQTKVSDYWLLGLRAGDSVNLGNQALSLYGGIRNLLDEDYFGNIRINANSDRPVDQRGYFEPAPGRTIYGGVSLAF